MMKSTIGTQLRKKGGTKVPEQIIYIYYDTVGNNVLSKGIVNQNKKTLWKRIPNNLLLIKEQASVGVYDNYTGFRVVKGQEEVKQFLDSGIGQPSQLGAWIDFSSVDMLHQLTPVEISEILYLAHAHNYLHSPFYYKLQNNYIYLSLPNNFTKIYYRYLEEFLDQFAESITQRMQNKVNEKKRFFQKDRVIAPFDVDNQSDLVPIFREGVCLSFRQMKIENDVYRVPIFVCEDQLSLLENPFGEEKQMGTLSYDATQERWHLEYQFE